MITLKKRPQADAAPSGPPGITLKKRTLAALPAEAPPSAAAAVKAMTDGLQALAMRHRGPHLAPPSHAALLSAAAKTAAPFVVRPAPMPGPRHKYPPLNCHCSTCLRIAATE